MPIPSEPLAASNATTAMPQGDWIPQPFRPPWFLRNGHLQTILVSRRLIASPELPSQRYRVPLTSRGSTYVFVSENEQTIATLPTLILLHGLAGSSSSPYLMRIGRNALDLGFRVVRIDLPGSGTSAGLTDLPAHAGCSGEVAAIMRWLGRELNVHSWVISGFSLGGNVTLKLLAELDDQDPLRSAIHSAIAVAPPIDLHFCSRSMERGVNRIYTKFFLDNLKMQRRRRAEKWPSWAARPEKPLPRSIREFDNRHTAPIAGYRDVNDYYNQASTASRIASLAIPTEILADTHDPIVPFAIFRSMQSTPQVQLTVTRHGGHLGYFYQQSGEYRCWMDDWFQAKFLRVKQSVLAGQAKS